MKNFYQIYNENKNKEYIYHGVWGDNFRDKIETPIYFTNKYLVAKAFSCNREGGDEIINISDIEKMKPPVNVIIKMNNDTHLETVPYSELFNIYADWVYVGGDYDLSKNQLVFDDSEEIADYIDVDYLSNLFNVDIDLDDINEIIIENREVNSKIKTDEFGIIKAKIKDNAIIKAVDVKRKIWDSDVQELINLVEKTKKYDVLVLKNITEGGLLKPIPVNSDTYVIFNGSVLNIL